MKLITIPTLLPPAVKLGDWGQPIRRFFLDITLVGMVKTYAREPSQGIKTGLFPYPVFMSSRQEALLDTKELDLEQREEAPLSEQGSS